ncbi:MAG: LysE family translocator [Pseudomonadota bacterium]
MSIEFLITSIIVILMPGTGVIYTLAIGLGLGFRSAVAAAFGCTLGIVPSAVAGIAGLSAIFHTSALAFQAVKIAGVIYLLYMAWATLRDTGVLGVEERRERVPAGRIIRDGALLNVLNPKLALFFLAFLPQFVPVGSTQGSAAFIWLALAFMGLTFVVFVGYGACAAWARDYVISRPRVLAWIRRGFAGAFGLLGLRLALAER